MKRTIEIIAQSQKEDGCEDPIPFAGAVLVKDNKEIGTCFRGETGEGNHADFI